MSVESAFDGSLTPYVVGIGGTLRANSSTERAINRILESVRLQGARTLLISGHELELPVYAPENTQRTAAAEHLVSELRRADAIVIGSPGYHGGISGLIKNALDYTEDMKNDRRPYFDGRPVACVATGAGWQGAVATLMAIRATVHALRGWPTPLGAAINTIEPVFTPDGNCLSKDLQATFDTIASQLLFFIQGRVINAELLQSA